MQVGKNGEGQLSDGNKVVQTDENGAGQYIDDKVTIQRNEDGYGQYINNVTGVTLQIDSDEAGQYLDASDEDNKTLSDNRAKSVKEFLASQGVTANITTNGYGESRPIASNDTPEGKQRNRRVEIIIPIM